MVLLKSQESFLQRLTFYLLRLMREGSGGSGVTSGCLERPSVMSDPAAGLYLARAHPGKDAHLSWVWVLFLEPLRTVHETSPVM